MRARRDPLFEFYIREMTVSDVPEVAELEQRIFSEPWSEAGFLDELRQSYSLYLTVRARQGGELAAYCALLQSRDEAAILNVAVRKEVRGRGIGYAMVKELMDRGRARGVKRFTLEVRKSNQAALRLYEKLGFYQAGLRPEFYTKPVEDALILWT